MRDHAPWASAFFELAIVTFLELIEDAACFADAFNQAGEAMDRETPELPGRQAESGDERRDAVLDGDTFTRLAFAARQFQPEAPPWQRSLQLAYATGYVLRTKVEGWNQFCAEAKLPPTLHWELLPGYDRFQRVLSVVAKGSFDAEGMRDWTNAVRSPGEQRITQVKFTPESVAKRTQATFVERVRLRGGDE